MEPDPDDMPEAFVLPDLPAELDRWFEFAGALGDDTEVIYEGAMVDDLRVVDADAARLALVGYRFVFENGAWSDSAATGEWDESWIVIESVNADPIIADLSTPGIAVLEARHGEGRWDPQPAFETLAEFIDSLEVNDDVPGPPPLDEALLPVLAVWATDLGPEPLKTLIQLRNWPLFAEMSRPEMLRARANLPVMLADHLNLGQAESCVRYGARFGATFEIRPGEPDEDDEDDEDDDWTD